MEVDDGSSEDFSDLDEDTLAMLDKAESDFVGECNSLLLTLALAQLSSPWVNS